MSIVVKEVVSKKDLKKWVDFPNKMYKKVPEFVPFLLYSPFLCVFYTKINSLLWYILLYKNGKVNKTLLKKQLSTFGTILQIETVVFVQNNE